MADHVAVKLVATAFEYCIPLDLHSRAGSPFPSAQCIPLCLLKVAAEGGLTAFSHLKASCSRGPAMASAIAAAGAVSWAGFNCCSVSTQHVSGLNLGNCLILLTCRIFVGLRLRGWLPAALFTLTMSRNNLDNGLKQIIRLRPSVVTCGKNSPHVCTRRICHNLPFVNSRHQAN